MRTQNPSRLPVVLVALFAAACAPGSKRPADHADKAVFQPALPLAEPLGCAMYSGTDRPDIDKQGLACLAEWETAELPSTAVQESQQAYLEGLIDFQKGDLEKARASWKAALKLDAANKDAEAALVKLGDISKRP
ncbi:MAG: hypothetical protein AAB320_02445 [Elusimicrobiota bacterium]